MYYTDRYVLKPVRPVWNSDHYEEVISRNKINLYENNF